MESKLVKLKTDFNNIITVRTTVKNIFDMLLIRIGLTSIINTTDWRQNEILEIQKIH